MLRADAARADQLLLQRGAGTMSAHRRIARSQVVLRGKVNERAATEIDLAQNLNIGPLQRRQQLPNAAADDALSEFVVEIGAFAILFKFGSPAFERNIFRLAAARVIDDGVAQDGVEPRDDGAAVAYGVDALQRTDVGALQNVLCERAIL